jgi:6,7-dimethyl-8-ribityllumazine synthase
MPSRKEVRIGIVVGRFNELITSRLLEGARKALVREGVLVENIFEVEVPGSFEIPLAAQWLADVRKVDGVIALGAVIRGSTNHYEYVCSTASSGLMNVQLSHKIPVGFGILTCDTLEQAFDRAGGKLGNKGTESAQTVLEMVSLRQSLGERRE